VIITATPGRLLGMVARTNMLERPKRRPAPFNGSSRDHGTVTLVLEEVGVAGGLVVGGGSGAGLVAVGGGAGGVGGRGAGGVGAWGAGGLGEGGRVGRPLVVWGGGEAGGLGIGGEGAGGLVIEKGLSP